MSIKRIKIQWVVGLIVLFSLSSCAFKKTEVYRERDMARAAYTDKEVNYIVYFGDVNHFIFYIDDPKIKYLIKNIPQGKGLLHINIANNHYVEKVNQTIKSNSIDVYFYEKDVPPELNQWAKINKLFYSDIGGNGYYYSYQVIKPVHLYKANHQVNHYIKEDETKLHMSFSTTLNPELVVREESPVVIKNNEPYLNDQRLFRFIEVDPMGGGTTRWLRYQENVK